MDRRQKHACDAYWAGNPKDRDYGYECARCLSTRYEGEYECPACGFSGDESDMVYTSQEVAKNLLEFGSYGRPTAVGCPATNPDWAFFEVCMPDRSVFCEPLPDLDRACAEMADTWPEVEVSRRLEEIEDEHADLFGHPDGFYAEDRLPKAVR